MAPEIFRSTDAAWCFCLCWREVCLPAGKTGTSVGEEESPVFIAWTGGTGACAAASDGIHGRDDRDETQFALPVAGAFLGMYVTERLAELWNGRDRGTGYWLLLVCRLCICLVIAVQTGYDLRLAVTDEIRCREDEQKTRQLLERLCRGRRRGTAAASGGVCGLSGGRLSRSGAGGPEMYGWSFYGWDYSMENPTGATHRICGFVQAYTGNVLREDATEEQKRHAVELAGQMKDFPEEGSVLVTEDCVVVRLSEVKEQMPTDWW